MDLHLKKRANTNTFTIMTEKELNTWWGQTDFREMEKITRLRQLDFSPEDGYQDFVDVCDNWWDGLSKEYKQDVYNDRH